MAGLISLSVEEAPLETLRLQLSLQPEAAGAGPQPLQQQQATEGLSPHSELVKLRQALELKPSRSCQTA